MAYTLATLPYDVLMCVLRFLTVAELVLVARVSSSLRRAVASGRFFEQTIQYEWMGDSRRILLELYLLNGGDVSSRGVGPLISQAIAFSVYSKSTLHMPLLSHLDADVCRQMGSEFSPVRAATAGMAREDA